MKKSLLIGVAALTTAAGVWGYQRLKPSTPWYHGWLSQPYTQGCRFNSEFELKAGATTKVEIQSQKPLWVSWVTKNSEVITNNSHAVVLGRTESSPYRPGVRGMPIFIEPKAGVIPVYLRNESGVDTRLMVWTASEDDDPVITRGLKKGEEKETASWGNGEK